MKKSVGSLLKSISKKIRAEANLIDCKVDLMFDVRDVFRSHALAGKPSGVQQADDAPRGKPMQDEPAPAVGKPMQDETTFEPTKDADDYEAAFRILGNHDWPGLAAMAEAWVQQCAAPIEAS